MSVQEEAVAILHEFANSSPTVRVEGESRCSHCYVRWPRVVTDHKADCLWARASNLSMRLKS